MSASFYPNCAPSRAARRRIAKAQAAVDRVTDADRKFFARRPEREFRMRLASTAEIETAGAVLDEDQVPVPGGRFVMLVRRLGPDVRFRVLAQSWAWKADDFDAVGDEEAGRAYRHTCRPGNAAKTRERIRILCEAGRLEAIGEADIEGKHYREAYRINRLGKH